MQDKVEPAIWRSSAVMWRVAAVAGLAVGVALPFVVMWFFADFPHHVARTTWQALGIFAICVPIAIGIGFVWLEMVNYSGVWGWLSTRLWAGAWLALWGLHMVLLIAGTGGEIWIPPLDLFAYNVLLPTAFVAVQVWVAWKAWAVSKAQRP